MLVGSIVAVILAVSLSSDSNDAKTASDKSDPNAPVDTGDIIGNGTKSLPNMPTSNPETGKYLCV